MPTDGEIMMNKVKYYILLCLLLIPIIAFVSCMGGGGEGGEFDLVKLIGNPVVQVLIFIMVLWFLFKGRKK